MRERIWTLFMARTREFFRDRSSLGWNLFFPFLVIIGFGLLFNQDRQVLYKVGIVNAQHGAAADDARYRRFRETKHLDFVEFVSRDDALEKLRHHRVDLVVDPGSRRYWVSETSPRGYVVERLLMAGVGEGANGYVKQSVAGREIPYVEWLFPGVLGMNIMFSSLFGVGYVVVRYRKNGALKRLSVTPVRPFEFLGAQVLSRLFVIMVTTGIVYTGSVVIYRFQCRGSYLTLFLVFVLGSFSMISLGLLIACRSSSEEFADGVLNLITWPMMFLSEVWFSLEGARPWVHKAAKAFPLTYMVDGARRVMNDGAGAGDIGPHLAAMAAMSAVFILTGSLLFKWQKT